ncbi:hypothetical protein CDL15_Pgr005502 [Punica granatum]|nr:hypothetical protein CDL15_Pgr005502 [Punica granatum]PKI42318.1 hypothetical protein CRG98_037289 [Punica granatum]
MRVPEGIILIIQWVTLFIEAGDIQSSIDPRLDGKLESNSAWKLVETAMECVRAAAIQRPDISQVLLELKECWAMETTAFGRRLGDSFEMTPAVLDSDSSPSAR